MSDGTRLLDVNLNRASEAGRVLEDVARFTLEDPRTAGELKSLRHAMTAAVLRLAPQIEAARVGRRDVGREVSAPGESRRESMESIVRAAASRLGQASRVLEEIAKLSDPAIARSLESMRYQGYDLSGEVVSGCTRKSKNLWQTCLLLTCRTCRLEWREVLAGALAGGIQCVQIREKTMSDGRLLEHAREVVAMVHGHGAIAIVDDRADIAVASGADGVHVGDDDLEISACREILGTSRVIGATAQTPHAVAAAFAEGADYCGIGAIQASRTRPDRDIIGVEGFQACAADGQVDPSMLVGIGGLDARSIEKLVRVGCTRVAVSSFICAAASPAAASSSVVSAVTGTDRPVQIEQTVHGT